MTHNQHDLISIYILYWREINPGYNSGYNFFSPFHFFDVWLRRWWCPRRTWEEKEAEVKIVKDLFNRIYEREKKKDKKYSLSFAKTIVERKNIWLSHWHGDREREREWMHILMILSNCMAWLPSSLENFQKFSMVQQKKIENQRNPVIHLLLAALQILSWCLTKWLNGFQGGMSGIRIP